jgi:hypothetical protein
MFPRTDSRDGRKMPPRTFRFPDVLDCETLGLQLVGTDENGEEMEHDHANKARQERYPLAGRPAPSTRRRPRATNETVRGRPRRDLPATRRRRRGARRGCGGALTAP